MQLSARHIFLYIPAQQTPGVPGCCWTDPWGSGADTHIACRSLCDSGCGRTVWALGEPGGFWCCPWHSQETLVSFNRTDRLPVWTGCLCVTKGKGVEENASSSFVSVIISFTLKPVTLSQELFLPPHLLRAHNLSYQDSFTCFRWGWTQLQGWKLGWACLVSRWTVLLLSKAMNCAQRAAPSSQSDSSMNGSKKSKLQISHMNIKPDNLSLPLKFTLFT